MKLIELIKDLDSLPHRADLAKVAITIDKMILVYRDGTRAQIELSIELTDLCHENSHK